MARHDGGMREGRAGFGPVARLMAVAGALALGLGLGRREPRHAMAGSGAAAGVAEDPSGRGKPGVPPSGQAQRSGHETEDMKGAMMVRLGLMLGSIAFVMVFVMIGVRTWVRTRSIDHQPALTLLQMAAQRPPAPTLQANPVQEWDAVRGRAAALLENYAWVGPDHARARIPIERGMALTAGQGMGPPP